MTGTITDLVGFLGQARRNQPDEIAFDLKINVIGVNVIIGVTGLRREYTIEIIFSGLNIGVPQHVASFGK